MPSRLLYSIDCLYMTCPTALCCILREHNPSHSILINGGNCMQFASKDLQGTCVGPNFNPNIWTQEICTNSIIMERLSRYFPPKQSPNFGALLTFFPSKENWRTTCWFEDRPIFFWNEVQYIQIPWMKEPKFENAWTTSRRALNLQTKEAFHISNSLGSFSAMEDSGENWPDWPQVLVK